MYLADVRIKEIEELTVQCEDMQSKFEEEYIRRVEAEEKEAEND